MSALLRESVCLTALLLARPRRWYNHYLNLKQEFIVKLSHHGLLDRLNNQSNSIGFINDFVFGYLIADSIVKAEANNLDLKRISAKFWDLMITAYTFGRHNTKPTVLQLMNKDNDLAKEFFRCDRRELIVYLTKVRIKLPLTISNMVFLMNYLSIKHPDVSKMTPEVLKNIL